MVFDGFGFGFGFEKGFYAVPLCIFNKLVNSKFLGFTLSIGAGNLGHHFDIFIGVLTGISADGSSPLISIHLR